MASRFDERGTVAPFLTLIGVGLALIGVGLALRKGTR